MVIDIILYSVEHSLNQCIDCILISGVGLFDKSVGYHHADGHSLVSHQSAKSCQS